MAESLSSAILEQIGFTGKASTVPIPDLRCPMARRLLSIFLPTAAFSCFKSAAEVCGSNPLPAQWRPHLCNRHSTNRMRGSLPMGDGWHTRPTRRADLKSMYDQLQILQ